MSFEVTVAPRAVEEFAGLVQWWIENRPDSRIDLYGEFEDALAYLGESPLAASQYLFDGRYLVYRIKTTPYMLLYRMRQGEASSWLLHGLPSAAKRRTCPERTRGRQQHCHVPRVGNVRPAGLSYTAPCVVLTLCPHRDQQEEDVRLEDLNLE